MRRCPAIFQVIFVLSGSVAFAGEDPADTPTETTVWGKALRNDYYKISMNVRGRMEIADQEGLQKSRANAFRTLLGLQTMSFDGVSGFVQLENNTALNDDRYFSTTHASNGKTAITDPRHTSLNQAWGRYENNELWGLDAKGGRQLIRYDDERFVGAVDWRQNMQTFDSARVDSNLGVDGLRASFVYIWEVLRIFGDQGPAANKDFDAESPLFHLSYDELEWIDISAFAYFLDFDNSPVNSANSYGFRTKGKHSINERWSLPWVASYAYQTDAGDNTVSYHAHYVKAEAGVDLEDRGTLKAGYELLGSDDGKARFVTPLATGHKFNGYADAFLNNGGVNGLQDLYVTLAPDLPCKFKGHVTYHRFWSDENSDDLGQEWDAVLKRPITSYLSGLGKIAYFNGKSPGPADRWRYWIEFTFNY